MKMKVGQNFQFVCDDGPINACREISFKECVRYTCCYGRAFSSKARGGQAIAARLVLRDQDKINGWVDL
jgi:hypothetical protein